MLTFCLENETMDFSLQLTTCNCVCVCVFVQVGFFRVILHGATAQHRLWFDILGDKSAERSVSMAHPMHRACSLFTPQSLFCADVLMRLRPSRFSIHRRRLLCTFFLFSSTVVSLVYALCSSCAPDNNNFFGDGVRIVSKHLVMQQ